MAITINITGVKTLNHKKAWNVASAKLDQNIFPAIKMMVINEKGEGIPEHLKAYVTGVSTTGFDVFKNEDGTMRVEFLPTISYGDMLVAFAFLEAVKEQRPRCRIRFKEDKDDLEIDNGTVLALMSFYEKHLLDFFHNNTEEVTIMEGIRHPFYINAKHYVEQSASDEEMLEKFWIDYINLQWKTEDWNWASRANITTPSGETYVAHIINREEDTFYGVGDRVALLKDKEVKMVKREVFLAAMEGNKKFERLDYYQFSLKKMSKREFAKLYDSLEGEIVKQHAPNTYIMRWNPAISSFTMDAFKEAIEQYPEGFGIDWSIWEHDEARPGDKFYMVQVGEINTGIVWAGTICSEAYQDEDWSGKGRETWYVKCDIELWSEPEGEPLISSKKLSNAIPEIEWNHGHSGMKITNEQAEIIERLLDE